MSVFEIIYLDPPWKFDNTNTGGTMLSGSSAKYKVMTLTDIAALPVPEIAAVDCTLFMWWIASMPREGLFLLDAWGFELKTMTGLVWVKRTKNWKLHFGMGFQTRQGTENCLIATRGKPKRVSASVRAVVEAVVEEHSKKPDIFADKIVELMGDKPRIELFARDHKAGWSAWGNEVESTIWNE